MNKVSWDRAIDKSNGHLCCRPRNSVEWSGSSSSRLWRRHRVAEDDQCLGGLIAVRNASRATALTVSTVILSTVILSTLVLVVGYQTRPVGRSSGIDFLCAKWGLSAVGFKGSLHRPHTMIGYALGNAMNMGVTLAIYGSICQATGAPFVFPGRPQQYGGVCDITDARLLGRHVVWSATEPQARNQAFNTVNGDVFRWRELWKSIAAGLGIEAAEYPGSPNPLANRMDHADDVWAKLVAKHDLAPYKASELASWWHTDADLGREVETFADMSKSRTMGFLDYQPTPSRSPISSTNSAPPRSSPAELKQSTRFQGRRVDFSMRCLSHACHGGSGNAVLGRTPQGKKRRMPTRLANG